MGVRCRMTRLSRLDSVRRRLMGGTVRTAGGSCTGCDRFRMNTTYLLTSNEVMVKTGRRGTTFPSNLYTRHDTVFKTRDGCPRRTVAALTVTTHGRGNFLGDPVSPYNTYERIVLRVRSQCRRPIYVLLCNRGYACHFRDVGSLLPFSFMSTGVGRWSFKLFLRVDVRAGVWGNAGPP